MCSSDIFLGLLAFLFPPLPVWVKRGICSADSIINIALCMLGFIPGLLHAWYIISKYPDPDYGYAALDHQQADAEGARGVTYYYVQHRPGHVASVRPAPNSQPGYGTTEPMPVQAAAGLSEGAGGSSAAAGVPPTYAEAVKGDNKVQT